MTDPVEWSPEALALLDSLWPTKESTPKIQRGLKPLLNRLPAQPSGLCSRKPGMKITLKGPPDEMYGSLRVALAFLEKYASAGSHTIGRNSVGYGAPDNNDIMRWAWGDARHVRVRANV
jgi:hypothetical protein